MVLLCIIHLPINQFYHDKRFIKCCFNLKSLTDFKQSTGFPENNFIKLLFSAKYNICLYR